MGALLLSFYAPAQLDAPHAANLLLLASALAAAPELLEAAATPLLQQCNLILGCDLQPLSALGGGPGATTEAEAAAASEGGDEEDEEEVASAAGCG
jgi:hypothetical protein